VVEWAIRALRQLGQTKKEALEDVARLIEGDPERAWIAEDLIQEALRAAPMPRGSRFLDG
jgi:hypothetical protein